MKQLFVETRAKINTEGQAKVQLRHYTCGNVMRELQVLANGETITFTAPCATCGYTVASLLGIHVFQAISKTPINGKLTLQAQRAEPLPEPEAEPMQTSFPSF